MSNGKVRVTYGMPKLGTTQEIAFSAGGSTAVTNAFADKTNAILLCATQDCRIKIAVSPTAAATDTLFPAGVPVPFQIEVGQSMKIAAYGETAGGKLSITELAE